MSRADPELSPDIPIRPTLRRISLLVGGALAILLVGSLLRPRAASQIPAVPTNELATLPELAQRRMMRDLASYIAERVESLAQFLAPLSLEGHGGVLVRPDSALIARAGPVVPFELVALGRSDSAGAVARIGSLDSITTSWVLVLARGETRRPLSLTGLAAGVLPVSCGPHRLRELVVPAVIPGSFLGAVAFDLDGNALALAVSCADRIALVSLSDMMGALRHQAVLERQLWARYGLRGIPADSAARVGLTAPPGVMLTEVLLGGPADRAGLWPGDVIHRVAPYTVARPADLASVLDTLHSTTIELQRGGRTATVSLDPSAASGRPTRSDSTSGITLAQVEPGSRAERAGLRAGDVILQVGYRRNPTSAAVRNALTGGKPILLVYQRDRQRYAVILS
jgi:PDZ domain-containing protein